MIVLHTIHACRCYTFVHMYDSAGLYYTWQKLFRTQFHSGNVDTSRASGNSAQLWHYLPRDGIRLHRLRVQSYKTVPTSTTSDTGHKSRLSPVLLVNQIGSSHDTSPWVQLIQQLTDFRETYYLIGDPFIIERCNSGASRGTRRTGQRKGEGHGGPRFSLRARHSPNISTCSPTGNSMNSVLLGLYGGGFQYIGIID